MSSYDYNLKCAKVEDPLNRDHKICGLVDEVGVEWFRVANMMPCFMHHTDKYRRSKINISICEDMLEFY